MAVIHHTHVFYKPGQQWSYDYAVQNEHGEWLSPTGRTFAALRAIEPGLEVVTLAEAEAQIYAAACEPVELIDEGRFGYALDCLPPQGWTRQRDCESFKMLEHQVDDITRIYVRRGDDYFRFSDRCTLTHAQIMEKVDAAAPALLAAREDV